MAFSTVSIEIPVERKAIVHAIAGNVQLSEPLEIVLNGKVVPNTPRNRAKLQRQLACATK